MSKLAILAMVVGVLAGCGQQQDQGQKPSVSPAKEEKSASTNELLMRAYQGSCTRVLSPEEIRRGVPCK